MLLSQHAYVTYNFLCLYTPVLYNPILVNSPVEMYKEYIKHKHKNLVEIFANAVL